MSKALAQLILAAPLWYATASTFGFWTAATYILAAMAFIALYPDDDAEDEA